MSTPARVVLLNGVGSVGKSSIAKALQTITIEPFLHVQMDAFFGMLPPALQQHPEGVHFETVSEDGKASVVIRSGPVAARCFRGMRHAVAAMAGQGNNLIVDDVMFYGASAEYVTLLSDLRVHWVGVFAPLDILESRERDRGDRLIGLARWQYHRVHQGVRYDLEIDASTATPMECASLIKERLRL